MRPRLLLIFLILFTVTPTTWAQKKPTRRQVLEARRVQNQKDQIYINALLSNAVRKEQNVMNELKDLNDKISIREKVIKSFEAETKELDNEIYLNQLEINKNNREIKALKKDYGEMIYSSYKSKSQNSRLMFLFSSEDFFQAYKRFQYMKQYTSFRKKQGEEIEEKTELLKVYSDSLKAKKDLKVTLLKEEKTERQKVENQKKEQQRLLSQVKQKESKYKKQIREFEAEERRINAQIDKIIADAIAASNKKANTSSGSSSGFALTAEAKALAAEFVQNKGKLPWPVEKGYVSTYYGKQPHPIVRTATIQSNGVRITTEKGSRARAVFDGEVLAVQVTTGNKKAVLVQHGNYITVYKNLENVRVNKGDKVKTKEVLGTVFTDRLTGKTILGFVLSKNTTTENPKSWIYKM
jgi:septal ring factor EnvC (AmiA/AmiB activator)